MTRRDLPNLLTFFRIGLGLVVFLGLASAAFGAALIPRLSTIAWLIYGSVLAFVVGAVTDFFDGWLARRWGATSPWGAMLDPIADKIAVCAAVLGLAVVQPRLTVVVAGGIILFRELFVSGLRETGAARGLRFPVTRLAKWKTTVQLVSLALEMGGAGLRVSEFAAYGHAGRTSALIYDVADTGLWIAAAVTVWTGAEYAAAAARQMRSQPG